MAEVAQDGFEFQLSKLKAEIDSHKVIIENKFAELVAACNEKKRVLLERLDSIMTESESRLRASQSEYRKLLESRRVLAESLQENGSQDSLRQCFIRMDSEIAKKRPTWSAPRLELAWNTHTILASIENLCTIRTEVSKCSGKAVSLTDIHTSLPDTESVELPRSAGWREHESITADQIVDKSTRPEEKIPCILRWQKERPTLEREVVYADNKDGTFRLEWNGECFEKSNIELSVGEHNGLLVLSDSNTSLSTDSFQIENTTKGIPAFTLHVKGELRHGNIVKAKESSQEGETQLVQLVWKKQHPTLNMCVEYIDNRDDRIALHWNGESFQSKQVLVGIGNHHGMLSLSDSDSLPLVELFSVRKCPGVQEVLLDTPSKQ